LVKSLVMKYALVIIITLIIAACNESGNGDTTIDSLGARTADTSSRSDTMYYERMTNKTGTGDTSVNRAGTKRQDTAYYERLGNKNARDSSQ
jgi:hypothetical protein